VLVELLKKKCLPVLLYGLEVCPLSSSHLKSLNYAVVSSFRKIFNVSSTETAKECMFMFGWQDISVMIEEKEKKIFTETGFVKECCLDCVSRVCVKGSIIYCLYSVCVRVRVSVCMIFKNVYCFCYHYW